MADLKLALQIIAETGNAINGLKAVADGIEAQARQASDDVEDQAAAGRLLFGDDGSRGRHQGVTDPPPQGQSSARQCARGTEATGSGDVATDAA